MQPTMPPLWIDARLRGLPARPWRKIHLDYHNSQHMPSVGERFDADEFGDRLLAAHVDAIVVFAKDMHGYFYYPSAYGPVHNGLKCDLLGEQVRACRRRDGRCRYTAIRGSATRSFAGPKPKARTVWTLIGRKRTSVASTASRRRWAHPSMNAANKA